MEYSHILYVGVNKILLMLIREVKSNKIGRTKLINDHVHRSKPTVSMLLRHLLQMLSSEPSLPVCIRSPSFLTVHPACSILMHNSCFPVSAYSPVRSAWIPLGYKSASLLDSRYDAFSVAFLQVWPDTQK